MHVEDMQEDKQTGVHVGYTVLVLIGVTITLIIVANLII